MPRFTSLTPLPTAAEKPAIKPTQARARVQVQPPAASGISDAMLCYLIDPANPEAAKTRLPEIRAAFDAFRLGHPCPDLRTAWLKFEREHKIVPVNFKDDAPPKVTCTPEVAAAFGLDKLPANIVQIVPAPAENPMKNFLRRRFNRNTTDKPTS